MLGFNFFGKIDVRKGLLLLLLCCIGAAICEAQAGRQEIEKALAAVRILADERPDSAFLRGKAALNRARDLGYTSQEAEAHQLLGELLYHQGAYSQSLNHYFQAIEQFQQLGKRAALASCYQQVGILDYYMKQPEQALEHQRQALELYRQLDDQQGMARAYGELGHLYEKRAQYDSALFYQEKALQGYEGLNDSVGIARILENMGSIYEDQSNYERAFDYFTQSNRYNEQLGERYALLGTLNNLGDIYRKTGRYEQALAHTQRALRLARELDEKYEASSALRDLGKTYRALGQHAKAYEALNAGRELYEKIYSEETGQQLALLQTLFEIEQKNNEIQLLEQERTLTNLYKIVAILGAMLIGLLALVVISRQRLRIRKNKELLQEREKAYKTERHLMEVELENQKLSEERLQQALKAKSKELTSYTLNALNKNRTLAEIKSDLQGILDAESRAYKRKLQKLVRKIDQDFQQDKDWETFRQIFEQVHDSFFQRLQERFPDLTPGETRLAALLRLKLNSPDIATLLAISTDSLRVARYRLRKRLQLARGENLEAFIQGI